jgi:hypothetical protein
MPGRSSGNLLDRWNDPGGERITTDDITPSDGAHLTIAGLRKQAALDWRVLALDR